MGPAHAQATRAAAGYPSNLTDAQWQVIGPFLPAYVPGRRGRPPLWPARAIVDAILYVNRTGCAWRYLPADFPPWRTAWPGASPSPPRNEPIYQTFTQTSNNHIIPPNCRETLLEHPRIKVN
jgi:transposase